MTQAEQSTVDDKPRSKRYFQKREYNEKNKERIKKQRHEYHIKNKTKINFKSKEYRRINKEAVKRYNKEYYKNYYIKPEIKEKIRIRYTMNKEKLLEYKKIQHKEIKIKVLNHYSNGNMCCACCGEQILDFLSIDHINNDGAKQRRELNLKGSNFYKWLIKNNFPEGYQVLCMNCNFSKGHNKEGVCVHKRK